MQRETIVNTIKDVREQIIDAFEKIDQNSFKRTSWEYQKGVGGGEIAVLRGEHFEKAAVNFSEVSGDHYPLDPKKGPFFATGVSLITHMQNPHAPTVHMNIRYLESEESYWFGGGYDLTPMGFPYEEDTQHFHSIAKTTLDQFSPNLYPDFSKQAQEYFFIKHRNKERGVGGIFFDYLNSGDFKQDFSLWEAIGRSFLPAILPIYNKRIQTSYNQEDKEKQNFLRAHYVEFNLIYDRGTRFGFQSGGNHEAILCSMPPSASW